MKLPTTAPMAHGRGLDVVTCVVLLLALSGCGTAASMSPNTTRTTSAAQADIVSSPVDGSVLDGHIHHIALTPDALVIGTHGGVFQQVGDERPIRVSDEAFDAMGLAVTDDLWFASGHPAPGTTAPHNLGLLASRDSGKTWTSVALSGAADFHRLVVRGNVIMGISSVTASLMRSTDGGDSWSDLGPTQIFDIAIASANGSIVVGTSPQGLLRSVDGGATFSAVPDTPLLVLLAADRSRLVGTDTSGNVFSSVDEGVTWRQLGNLGTPPTAISVLGDRIAAFADSTIYVSEDSGVTFTPSIVNIPTH